MLARFAPRVFAKCMFTFTSCPRARARFVLIHHIPRKSGRQPSTHTQTRKHTRPDRISGCIQAEKRWSNPSRDAHTQRTHTPHTHTPPQLFAAAWRKRMERKYLRSAAAAVATTSSSQTPCATAVCGCGCCAFTVPCVCLPLVRERARDQYWICIGTHTFEEKIQINPNCALVNLTRASYRLCWQLSQP